MHRWLLALLALLGTAAARADVVTKAVECRHGDAVLEGCLAYDDAITDKRPGVLVAHEDGGNGPSRGSAPSSGRGSATAPSPSRLTSSSKRPPGRCGASGPSSTTPCGTGTSPRNRVPPCPPT